uniref:Uncharacterized protein n=1 Tax=viral metagenome TaxID=1070528 RepID=A0A6C0CRG4_9ZZZZ
MPFKGSNGELVDKYTWLILKQRFLFLNKHEKALRRVSNDLNSLDHCLYPFMKQRNIKEKIDDLFFVNTFLWKIKKRLYWYIQRDDIQGSLCCVETFVEINTIRHIIKKHIDLLTSNGYNISLIKDN